MRPFEVFPQRVWEDLLEKVEDINDRVAIVKCHPELEVLYFPVVLPTVINTLRTWATPSVERDVLSLRLVSRMVCNAVDKSLASRWDNYSDIPVEIYRLNVRGNFTEGGSVNRFLGEMGNHPKSRSPLVNPFILFEVSLDNWNRVIHRQSLLVKVGPYLKGLCFSLEANCLEFSWDFVMRNRAFLLGSLTLTPNLVQLTLVSGQRYNIGEDVFRELPTVGIEKLNLPDLPFLRSIKIGDLTPSHVRFFRLEKYFPQLTRLSLKLDHWKEDYCAKPELFMNLQYLSVSNTSDHPPLYLSSCTVAEYKEKLISICSIQAPEIKEVRLELTHGGKEEYKTATCEALSEGLQFLRKRFKGECNWKCIGKEENDSTWQRTLSRTTEKEVDWFFRKSDWEDAAPATGVIVAGLLLLAYTIRQF